MIPRPSPEQLIKTWLQDPSCGGYPRPYGPQWPGMIHPYHAGRFAKTIIASLELHGWAIVRKEALDGQDPDDLQAG